MQNADHIEQYFKGKTLRYLPHCGNTGICFWSHVLRFHCYDIYWHCNSIRILL